MKRLRNYFISGLLFWIPFALSVLVVKFFIEFIDGILPAKYLPEILLEYDQLIPGFGIFLIVIMVLITGILISNFIGKTIFSWWEKLLNRIPGFRSIYSALKQLSSTILSPSGDSFKKALLVEYPRKGMWTIAFQTGNYRGEVEDKIGEEIVNIYVPTTPNPTSGFFIMLPKKDTFELDMSVDEAFKLIISTGVIEPQPTKKTP